MGAADSKIYADTVPGGPNAIASSQVLRRTCLCPAIATTEVFAREPRLGGITYVLGNSEIRLIRRMQALGNLNGFHSTPANTGIVEKVWGKPKEKSGVMNFLGNVTPPWVYRKSALHMENYSHTLHWFCLRLLQITIKSWLSQTTATLRRTSHFRWMMSPLPNTVSKLRLRSRALTTQAQLRSLIQRR